MSYIAFLHTADVHVATFDRLMLEHNCSAEAIHLVRADLLAQAREQGVTADLVQEVQGLVHQLAAQGASLIVCTCSSLGDIAENCESPVPVWRVDRPMMEAAVVQGSRILVVTTVASTLQPTKELLSAVAQDMGRPIEMIDLFCAEAWPYFEAEDLDGYARSVADEILAAPASDVVVLAQASMAPAAAYCQTLNAPIFDSPTTGISAISKFFATL